MLSLISRVLLIATLFSVTPALAQTQSAEQDKNPAPRWLVNCNNQANPDTLACSMSQSIFRAKTRQRIVSASIFRSQQDALLMRLVLPHGLDLTHGVTLAVDTGSASKYTINSADANGAYALIPLNGELINAMKAGSTAVFGLRNNSGNNINLQVSLNGFSSAFAMMNK